VQATRWFTVGTGGVVFNSYDGLSWNQLNSETTASLTGVSSTLTHIVVVGPSGLVLTSTNGGN
jgi:photosystem II stability/assembly factor-like uncharacterized protein